MFLKSLENSDKVLTVVLSSSNFVNIHVDCNICHGDLSASSEMCAVMRIINFLVTFDSDRHDVVLSDDVRQQVADILNLFTGTHNFHNFTSGKYAAHSFN